MRRAACFVVLAGVGCVFAIPAAAQTVSLPVEEVESAVSSAAETTRGTVADTAGTVQKAAASGGSSSGGTTSSPSSGSSGAPTTASTNPTSGDRDKCPPDRKGSSAGGGGGGANGDGGGSHALLASSASEGMARMQRNAQRDRERNGGVLGASTQSGSEGDTEALPSALSAPSLIPGDPDEFPLSIGLVLLALVGLGFVGVVAGVTGHVLGRVRST